ncbi:hypothetical protein GCM10010510_67260 [Streptomyces anandii JCM 4720]|nr:hypothetical protein GCM10010510_67260 [Streptomyces anandii JCM 4720]
MAMVAPADTFGAHFPVQDRRCGRRPASFPGESPGHQGEGCPGDQCLGVLEETLIAPGMAAGMHHPGRAAFDDPAAGQYDEAEAFLGRLMGLIVGLRCCFRPVDEFSGV